MRPSKRAFDLVCASIGAVVLVPVFLVIAVLIKREDGGPVFYRPIRIGQRGRRFRLWKFRTMRAGADREGIGLTVGDDERVTVVGRTLRRHKLDELPQILNVLAGDMSLVGPRPEDPRYVAMYTPEQRRVLELVPGITDPASIRYADESAVLGAVDDPEREYVERIMPEKIAMNLSYAQRAGLTSDVGVVIRTLARAAHA
jgi:lipopolysaccharide/colanic/teichoic acid biosynthesis glycosyltransferase